MTTYAAAGVSLAVAEGIVARLGAAAQSTWSEAVVGPFGGFAGLYALDDERLLAASTDGVGTKLVLARKAGRLRDAGRDLAAHCMNDVLTTGAEPIFFLDYAAAGRLELEQVAELVEGAADVCRAARCALLGGETAEMPGVYRDGELDFAGTCVGLVRRTDLVDGSRIEAGDHIVGLASAGLHANGFTLARRVLAKEGYDGDDLLAPTRLYLDDVRELRKRVDVRGLAHVTGGGILGNVSRILPDGLRAEVDWHAWERPAVFDWLARHVDEQELRRVFNLGIGYCAVVPRGEAAKSGFPVIGTIVRAAS
jgi:phosphoribosylformylglycinamidine cyclo-ligase